MWCGVLVRLPSSTNRAGARIESCPPASIEMPAGWVDRVLDWLGQGWHSASPRVASAPDAAPATAVTPLAAVRQEFVECLDDIPTREAADVAVRVTKARSLREVWHLRADVFNVISRHTDQREARERLAHLNRHFPVRAPRSGFGGFDALPHAHHRS